MKKEDTNLKTLEQQAMQAATEELQLRKGLEDAVRKAGYAAGKLAGYKAGYVAGQAKEEQP